MGLFWCPDCQDKTQFWYKDGRTFCDKCGWYDVIGEARESVSDDAVKAIKAWRELRPGQRIDIYATLEQQAIEWRREGEPTVDAETALALLRAAAGEA